MSSFKQRFEENSVIFCATLVVLSFGAGFSTRGYVLDPPQRIPVTCSVDGAASIEQGHTQRMSILQASLVELEKNASDRLVISYYQDKYKESADRIRKDMMAEQASYQSTINALSKKCADA
ncbi:hypothetical protein IMY97_22535 [Pectobacterium versatile]|uniref:hypothetical protein n=1 Tax=Pectobacterium versatile TaxID=2488639 RepID=UPI001660947A|nr:MULTISPECIES: hypothetical protein [Pectobacterium]MBD0848418.1 hypothetical protein [Pectobacterium carotovorum subsp. carotovorum]MBK4827469.1 hypothetical protein [Pectobacterium carotovorum subsp. carotovorum]UNE79728.1 hypothetical protein IMY97_22535 [Pectobacterium versatile]